MSWKTASLVLAVAAAIVGLAIAAGIGATAVFDLWARIDEPRAFAAGEISALLTARVAISLFAFQGVTVLLVFAANAFLSRAGASCLPFGMPKGGVKTLALAVLALLAFTTAYGALIYAIDKDALRQDLQPFADMMKSRTWWLVLIAAGIGAPLAEECLFRGLLFGTFRRTSLGFIGAALLTAMMWAVLHANYSIYGLVAITLIGIYLAFVRERTGTLVTSIVCHGFYNSLIVLILAFAPNGSLITGG
jgi:CAAX protease family protein